ncbi:MAG: 3-oxoacyl-[acyl-carrier-protein] synthase III C-terminal domain-containing protein [Candidatus Eisenbacteria bacterium]
MQLEIPGVRIAAVETCDFDRMPGYDTVSLLRLACPDRWERLLNSPVSRRLLAELGVERRHLTHVPGQVPDPERRNALDLARSALERLSARRPGVLNRLDAFIFVSTSNPNPSNCQAALLAERLGFTASCFDMKAGCSSGVLALAQGALLIAAGCERLLVVMAENLSQLTPVEDLRALLTVGDGAACVLLEKCEGPGFPSVLHTTAPEFASAFVLRTAFPPAQPDARYVYEFSAMQSMPEFVHHRWRELIHEGLAAAGTPVGELAQCYLHQTHAAQVESLVSDLGFEPGRVPGVVRDHGNMGSPTFAVAMAKTFTSIAPGQRYLMAAVGGGVSSCAIVAEHR